MEAYGKTAKGMAAEARKGSQMWMHGKLATYSGEDPFGQNRCDMRVRVEKACLLPREGGGGEEEEGTWWGGWLGRVQHAEPQPMAKEENLDGGTGGGLEPQQLQQDRQHLEEEVEEEEGEEQQQQQDSNSRPSSSTSSKRSRVRAFVKQLLRQLPWPGKENGTGISSWLK